MKDRTSLIVPEELVINKIYYIRGQKVMLDSHLAELYGVETKVLNQAISRNLERFPSDFMFQLDEQEWSKWSHNLWLQVGEAEERCQRHLQNKV